jgi:hypothetical protein
MTNSWIEYVKKYASEHNLSYKEALQQSKNSYSGGSIKSNYISKLVATKNKNSNINKIRNPSNYLKQKYPVETYDM